MCHSCVIEQIRTIKTAKVTNVTRKKNSRKQQKANRRKQSAAQGSVQNAARTAAQSGDVRTSAAEKSSAARKKAAERRAAEQAAREKRAAEEAAAVLEDITAEIDGALPGIGHSENAEDALRAAGSESMQAADAAVQQGTSSAFRERPVRPEFDPEKAADSDAEDAGTDSDSYRVPDPGVEIEPEMAAEREDLSGTDAENELPERDALEIHWNEDESQKADRSAASSESKEKDDSSAKGVAAYWTHFLDFLQEQWRRFCSQKLWVRIVSCVVAVVLLVVLVGYGYFHSKYLLMNISDGIFSSSEISAESDSQDQLENEELQSRQDSGQLSEQDVVEATGDVWSDSDVFNILLIGTDDRTTEFSDNARGDTCILLSINKATNQIHLVSFERAIGVKILSGEYEGQWDWLTHMFWYGGPYLMTQEIRENFKVDVTKYIRVNIHTFMELVDSVGGVDIDMTEAECNNINHPEGTFTAGNIKGMHVEDEVQQDLVPGVNHLNGATAMCYARLRAIDDDWHRVERQRKVILAAVENLKKLSLTELDSLLNNVLPLVQTNLTEADIASLLPEAGTFVNMDYDTITFPLKHTYGLMDGMCGRKVLALDFDTNAQELQRFLNGETTAEELTDKYENSDLGDYSYKNSESYQQNYEDAETVVGQGTYVQQTGKSKPTLVSSGMGSSSSTSQSAGTTLSNSADTSETESATGTQETESTGTQQSSSSLGVIESTSTDPSTGVITIIYYNAATGVRTAVASNPASGATTVTANDTTTGGTSSAHVEGSTAGAAAEAQMTGTETAAQQSAVGTEAAAQQAATETGTAQAADLTGAAAPAQ